MKVLVTQSCPPLCKPMDCSLPGSPVHEILQARILEWLPFPSPGDLLDPEIKPASPALVGGFFTTEPPRKPLTHRISVQKDVANSLISDFMLSAYC